LTGEGRHYGHPAQPTWQPALRPPTWHDGGHPSCPRHHPALSGEPGHTVMHCRGMGM
jgi:hypothetical protein